MLALPLHVLDGDEAERAVERDRGDEALVDGVLDLLRELGRGLVLEDRQPQLVERHGGQVEMIGAAHLVFAVDVVHVSAGILLQALVGFRQQILALAEE